MRTDPSTFDHLTPADEVAKNRDRPHPSLRKKDDCLRWILGVHGTTAPSRPSCFMYRLAA